MSLKTGFGSITETLLSLEVLGVLQPSNRNSIIQISEKQDKRLFSIDVSFAFPRPSTAVEIKEARLIVAAEKFDDSELFIDPRSSSLPDQFSSSTIYLDKILSGNDQYSVQWHFDFANGIYCAKDQTLSIILTFPYTDVATPPASDPVISTLSVTGQTGGSEAVFKNFR